MYKINDLHLSRECGYCMFTFIHTYVCVCECLHSIVFLFSYYFKCLYPLNIIYTPSFFSNTGQPEGWVHSLSETLILAEGSSL